jgi:hypothetical protein
MSKQIEIPSSNPQVFARRQSSNAGDQDVQMPDRRMPAGGAVRGSTPSSAGLPRLLTEREVADILGISVKTLRNWRCSGGPPLPFVKISRAVRYEPETVARFIAHQRRTSTSDTGAEA